MEDQSHTVNLEEIDTDSKADGERRGCMRSVVYLSTWKYAVISAKRNYKIRGYETEDQLKKVPNFGSLPDQQLKAICERLKPVLYPTQTCIIGEGDPVDEMFFIMSGKLSSTGRDGGDINFSAPLYLDEFCGEELSTWVQSSSDQLPISTRTITTHTEVEAFALMANDLKDVFKQFRPPSRYRSSKWRCWAAWIIQVAWRCYCLKKHEDVKRVKNDLAAADGSSTSSIGATPFATNEIRHRNSKSRMLMKAPAVFIRKPADPDLMDKEK
ncbi:hypothetical protein Q3G72_028220 [Acer saccharum]|nr:hypothetical protein Q3G72_028220 [Acer saccharum]